MRSRVLLAIVATQWRRWRRERLFFWIISAAAVLLLCSVALNVQQTATQLQERNQLQAVAEKDWHSQPDRHPHRVVHFGDFVFKPVQFFARWDWGVEQHAGTSIYLEGHRQNSANFSQSAQSSSLQQFGVLTPAFVEQVVVPLLMIFLGFGSLSQERESGLLMQLLASGARASELVFGKFLALYAVGLLALLPLLILLIWSLFTPGADATRGMILLGGYSVYLMICAALVIVLAGFAKSSYSALMICLALWVLACVAMPRVSSFVTRQYWPAPSWVAIEIEAENRLKKLGDSHNPNDPYFAAFKEKTLREYGVQRVEDLPFNYGGLLMQEGERLTAQVFDELNSNLQARYSLQNQRYRQMAWLNPAMAISTLSMAAAGTDFAHHLHFLQATEARRFAMIQALNKIHTEQISFANDRNERVSAKVLLRAPRQLYQAPNVAFAMPFVVQAGTVLLVWAGLCWALLHRVARRVGAGQ